MFYFFWFLFSLQLIYFFCLALFHCHLVDSYLIFNYLWRSRETVHIQGWVWIGSLVPGVCALKCEIKFAVADFCVVAMSLAINCLIWLFKINDMFFICHCTFVHLFYINTCPVNIRFLRILLSLFKTANNV